MRKEKFISILILISFLTIPIWASVKHIAKNIVKHEEQLRIVSQNNLQNPDGYSQKDCKYREQLSVFNISENNLLEHCDDLYKILIPLINTIKSNTDCKNFTQNYKLEDIQITSTEKEDFKVVTLKLTCQEDKYISFYIDLESNNSAVFFETPSFFDDPYTKIYELKNRSFINIQGNRFFLLEQKITYDETEHATDVLSYRKIDLIFFSFPVFTKLLRINNLNFHNHSITTTDETFNLDWRDCVLNNCDRVNWTFSSTITELDERGETKPISSKNTTGFISWDKNLKEFSFQEVNPSTGETKIINPKKLKQKNVSSAGLRFAQVFRSDLGGQSITINGKDYSSTNEGVLRSYYEGNTLIPQVTYIKSAYREYFANIDQFNNFFKLVDNKYTRQWIYEFMVDGKPCISSIAHRDSEKVNKDNLVCIKD